MIGLAGLGGTQSARADAERMLGTLAGRQRSIITPWDGTAIGIARGENGFAADIVDGGATSVSVLFAGEVFDDAG